MTETHTAAATAAVLDTASNASDGPNDMVPNDERKRQLLVDYSELEQFIFPPNLLYPKSSTLLYLYAMYGPTANGQLRGGAGAQRPVTQLELRRMVERADRDDLLDCFCGESHHTMTLSQQEAWLQMAHNLPRSPEPTPSDVRALLQPALTVDPVRQTLVLDFHLAQKLILDARRKRLRAMRTSLGSHATLSQTSRRKSMPTDDRGRRRGSTNTPKMSHSHPLHSPNRSLPLPTITTTTTPAAARATATTTTTSTTTTTTTTTATATLASANISGGGGGARSRSSSPLRSSLRTRGRTATNARSLNDPHRPRTDTNSLLNRFAHTMSVRINDPITILNVALVRDNDWTPEARGWDNTCCLRPPQRLYGASAAPPSHLQLQSSVHLQHLVAAKKAARMSL